MEYGKWNKEKGDECRPSVEFVLNEVQVSGVGRQASGPDSRFPGSRIHEKQ
jgi:hypothetical protein